MRGIKNKPPKKVKVVRKEERSEYFQTIAKHFIQRRGAPFFLSPKELELISSWERCEIPLQVILEGIENYFLESPARRRTQGKIQTLFLCAPFVKKAFDGYRERKVGERKEEKARNEKRVKARKEIERFLASLPPFLNFLREPFSKAQKALSRKNIDEEMLEKLEEEIESLLYLNAPEEVKEKVKQQVLREHEVRSEQDFFWIFRLKLVKILREGHRIPYISLFHY